MNRRQFNKSTLATIPLAMAGRAARAAESFGIPRPASGGKGWPFASPPAQIIPSNYVMEEFIVAGEARRYVTSSANAAPTNGLWETRYGDAAPYVTRVYVVRPVEAADFNGVAVVNWQNVTAGFDIGAPINPEIFRGYAWVGLTTQKIGVDGNPGLTKGLREWDPERYSSLSHPGDAWSYDIFTQMGRTLKTNSSAREVLLGDLVPQTVLATGASQSAMRLGSYINAAHHHERVYDGFHLTVHWGICPPVDEVPLGAMFTAVGDRLTGYHCQIRDDLDVPIMVVATECEARYNYPTRQADTNSFRFWEIAGAAHQGPSGSDTLQRIRQRDGVGIGQPAADRNFVEWGYINDAALRAVVNWAQKGVAPATFPLISMDGHTTDSFHRDPHGNVLGGIRVPELEVPAATYRGERNDIGDPTWLQGITEPFSRDKLARLYPEGRDRGWQAAVDRLLQKGAVLPEDESALRSRVG
jgi:hypothetical protein